MTLNDDLGHPFTSTGPAQRVVSLVPSLTEALGSVHPERLVGITDWCTHPGDLEASRVRGTKNPDVAAITALAPDLVVANKEENRELDVQRLRAAGVPVWVTDIETVPQALTSLDRLFTVALAWQRPAWWEQARDLWSGPAAAPVRRVAVPIWRDPWMVVGPQTFTADLLARVGLVVQAPVSRERYPHTEVAAVESSPAQAVLLPDEPYVFGPDDGPEAFTLPTFLVEGRLITWYGPSLVEAHATLTALVRQVADLQPPS